MNFLSPSIFEFSSGSLTAESRLKEIKGKLNDINGAINALESNLFMFLVFPELLIPKNDKSPNNDASNEIEAKRAELEKYYSLDRSEVLDKLSDLDSFKLGLQRNEYFFTEIIDEYRRKLGL